MADHDRAVPPTRGCVAKRESILSAARTVFGRDGYLRASIETIAGEAGVSTRTIYNHFDGKENLFAIVIEDSARQVTTALTELMQRHLDQVTDLQSALVDLGTDWVTPRREFADHFAMVRHLAAEAASLPDALLATWHDNGPSRAEDALARHFQHLADRRLLQLDNAQRAANHYIWLVLGEVNSRTQTGLPPLGVAEKKELIAAGVHAFLYGYSPRSSAPA
ncbi:TetR/AcrR family transcriptional regulator [Amycolatopsis keratiniphila]|uniref:HTH tetR-type domain-containing protein n=1 Tax=Amycolatopsis keratiniphila subsp. keratiniphila TaxID=227715 RepID=A0A1W2M3I6_9PSEU|nr:TetR/AcrR family transcriptional regulator [Amycolatopsis keratiniphila]ONF74373.1 hypothetical protein AVR91_0203545 [Amycolatopsis keratiniphila subsp. keratiniphila]